MERLFRPVSVVASTPTMSMASFPLSREWRVAALGAFCVIPAKAGIHGHRQGCRLERRLAIAGAEPLVPRPIRVPSTRSISGHQSGRSFDSSSRQRPEMPSRSTIPARFRSPARPIGGISRECFGPAGIAGHSTAVPVEPEYALEITPIRRSGGRNRVRNALWNGLPRRWRELLVIRRSELRRSGISRRAPRTACP